jgi:hypothetical protein
MPAFLLSPLIRALAIALGFAVVLGLWRWERHDRIAAEAVADAASARLGLAEQDAARWRQAADLRDAAIDARDAALAAQSAEVERWRVASAHAMEAARNAAEAARRHRDAADQRIDELMEAARARPETVRPLGPLVLGRVDRLFD